MSLRNKYTFREESLMWKFLYCQLRNGNPAAFMPKGNSIWKLYKESIETDKTESSLTTHFRRHMFYQIEEANISAEEVMFIVYALGICLSGRVRRILEHKHNIEIRVAADNTVKSYVINGDEYSFYGENDDILVLKNGHLYGWLMFFVAFFAVYAAFIALVARGEQESSTNVAPSTSIEVAVLAGVKNEEWGMDSPAVVTKTECREDFERVESGPSEVKRSRLSNSPNLYEKEREMFAGALSRQPGYTGIRALVADAELNYAVQKARELHISVVEFVGQHVRDKEATRVYEFR
uniref:DUF4258 domain-containing protein n=1 Tax=Syphacia muris TaxID=451379 RepID=A0A0N5AGN6_9BILA